MKLDVQFKKPIVAKVLHLWCYRDNRNSIDKLKCMVYKLLANGQQQEETYYRSYSL